MTRENNDSPVSEGGRNIPLGYLRTFLTLVVVAHHAVLAYHPYAPEQAKSLAAKPMLWMAFPIVDKQRWPGIDIFVGFNDVYFMSLLFLISGIFVWPSLVRKGAGGFLRDRALKLGTGFVLSVCLLAPLAYYPAYLATGAPASLSAFWEEWQQLGVYPAGPAWFLWVLLIFDLIAAIAFQYAKSSLKTLEQLSERLSRRPMFYFGALLFASALVYVPMAAVFGPEGWSSGGPFFVQTSRLLHYALYFFAGVGLGAYGQQRGLLATDGKLAQHWLRWVFAALGAFSLTVVLVIIIITSKGGAGPVISTLGNFSFSLSCACSSLALLSLFLRFARGAKPVFDFISANAYGIYLAHYICVNWLQWLLLPAQLSGAAKGSLVFTGAVLLSLGLSALVRRFPAIRRFL